MTSCASLPDPSKKAFLTAALDATEPDPPVRCKRPPDLTPFPAPRRVSIQSPIDDIDQGRAYGVALKQAEDNHATDTEKLSIWNDYCDDLEASDDARRQKKETIRADLIKTLEDPPKRDWWPF
jgi:hypothetical protein